MIEWIGQHFLHPSFILPWGAALAALPVVIHLINRLRFRRVRFAAMNFLLRSQQRNRRRLLIEQILLLLLRVGIVAAIVVLVSRLVLDPGALWIFRGAKSHHVVLLDDSGSMRDRWGETSAFREGLSVVRRLVAEGVRRPGSQRLTLLLLSQPERPLFVKRDVDNAFAAELETAFERLQSSHQSLDLVTGVEAAAALLSGDPGNVRHLHVVSDFRAVDWRERPALRAAFAAVVKSGASIDLARTVAEPHENLAITNLEGDVRTAAAGVPVRLYATVQNFGSKVAENVRLSVLADGSLLPMGVTIERLEAGEVRRTGIDVTFKTPGKHVVEVRLPEDALPEDGRRFAAVEINLAVPVLIIDGDPESDDGSYVATALAADPSVTGFSTRVESPDFLRREPLESYRCIYLLNVAQLPPDSVQIVSDYVRRGGGLAWFLGDTVNPTFYNDVLFGKAGGLFPVRLARTVRQMVRADETSLATDLSFADHPIFRVFQGQNNPFVESVKIQSWIPVAEDWVRNDNQRKDGVATIAYLAGNEPLAFERTFGRGRVLAFLSTAGPAWNDWSRNPSVVVLHLEIVKHLARENATLERRTVGEPIDVAFNPADYLDTVEISAPDTTGERVTRLKATRGTAEPGTDQAAPSAGAAPAAQPPLSSPAPAQAGAAGGNGNAAARPQSVRVAAVYRDTDRPGMYVVRLFKDQAAAPQERWIAFNLPPQESDLKTASTADILARLGGDVPVQIHDPGTFSWIEGHSSSQEARSLLLLALLGALIVEQLFAYRLSYHPRQASSQPVGEAAR
jgi:hypothetical protein